MSDWQHGLFGCFDNFSVCIITYFIPCYTAGKNAEAMGKSCVGYGCIYLIPIVNCITLTNLREEIRTLRGIDGTFCNDLLAVSFCSLCSLVQEAQELQMAGAQPGAMAMGRE